jgi:hypothetical protein
MSQQGKMAEASDDGMLYLTAFGLGEFVENETRRK